MASRSSRPPVSGRRRPSLIIWRHFCLSFVLPLVCALLAFAALFLLNDVFDDLGDFLKREVPAGVTMLYFLASQPQNISHVAPISTLLAASFMTMMMGRNNEITALRAAGLSIGACAMPVWVVAVLVCAGVFLVNESIGPKATSYATQIQTKWTEGTRKKQSRQRIAFHNRQERRDWFFEDFAAGKPSSGVIIRQYRPDGSTAWVLTAAKAEHRQQSWVFTGGDVKIYETQSSNLDGAPQFFVQKIESFPETPQTILSHSRDWELLTISELLSVLNDDFIPSPKIARLLHVLLWNRLTFPLASLVGALFGVSLTITTGRTGALRGFASAVALLVLFYLIGQLSLVLGKNNWLPPFWAGAATNLAFTVAGIVTMWKKQ